MTTVRSRVRMVRVVERSFDRVTGALIDTDIEEHAVREGGDPVARTVAMIDGYAAVESSRHPWAPGAFYRCEEYSFAGRQVRPDVMVEGFTPQEEARIARRVLPEVMLRIARVPLAFYKQAVVSAIAGRELSDHHVGAIAAAYQSPGSVGQAMSRLAGECEVPYRELIADIDATVAEGAPEELEELRLVMGALRAWAERTVDRVPVGQF